MPEPAPEPETVTHALLVVAVQAQVAWVATVIEPDVPVGGALISEGVSVKVHDGYDCVTVNDFPAIVSIADRGDLAVVLAGQAMHVGHALTAHSDASDTQGVVCVLLYAAALALAGTEAIVFKICEAIW